MMKAIFLLHFLFTGLFAYAQTTNKFEKYIILFEQRDSAEAPDKKDLIVFTGSSSITNWRNMNKDFPGKNIINRGFGGSETTDLILYADRIISAYDPEQVFIYVGENDLGSGKSAEQVAENFKVLFNKIRAGTDARIVYISIKPSPARSQLMPSMVRANSLIRQFLKGQKNTVYVDVFTPMLTREGKLKPDIYRSDSLHMNAAGYKIWVREIQPLLK